jgi:hypothetical protein
VAETLIQTDPPRGVDGAESVKDVMLGPPGFFTTREVDLETDCERASVTVTLIEKLPVAEGVHRRFFEFAVAQPFGSPV